MPHSYSNLCGCVDCDGYRMLSSPLRQGEDRSNRYRAETVGRPWREEMERSYYDEQSRGPWDHYIGPEAIMPTRPRPSRPYFENGTVNDVEFFSSFNSANQSDDYIYLVSHLEGLGVQVNESLESGSNPARSMGNAFEKLMRFRQTGRSQNRVAYRIRLIGDFESGNGDRRQRVTTIARNLCHQMNATELTRYFRYVVRCMMFRNHCLANGRSIPLTDLEVEVLMHGRGCGELTADNLGQYPAYASELNEGERQLLDDYFYAVYAAFIFRMVRAAQVSATGDYMEGPSALFDADGTLAYVNDQIINPRFSVNNFNPLISNRFAEEVVVPSSTRCTRCAVSSQQWYFIGQDAFCATCYVDEAHRQFGCAGCQMISSPWNMRRLDTNLFCENCQRDRIDICANCGNNAARGTMRADTRGRRQCSNCYQPEWKPQPWTPTGRNSFRLMPRNMTFGVEIETSRSPRYSELEGNTVWGAVREASTDGKEFVSPVLMGDKGLDEVTNFLSRGIELGWTVDRSCGTHIHVGLNHFDLDQKRNVAYAYLLAWPFVAELSGAERSMNPMCGDPQYTVLDIMSAEDIEDFAAERDRFEFVNWRSLLKYGTIEIRILKGTLDANLINLWTRWHCKFINKVARMPIRYLEQKMANPVAFCENIDRNLLRELREALGNSVYDAEGNAVLVPHNPFTEVEAQSRNRNTRRSRRAVRPASQWSPLPPAETVGRPRTALDVEMNLEDIAREASARVREGQVLREVPMPAPSARIASRRPTRR